MTFPHDRIPDRAAIVAVSAASIPMVEVSITVLALRFRAAASSRATVCETTPSGSERKMVAARVATSALLLAMPAPFGALRAHRIGYQERIAGVAQMPAHAVPHAADANPADRFLHCPLLLGWLARRRPGPCYTLGSHVGGGTTTSA
jgi:hypothetical protein